MIRTLCDFGLRSRIDYQRREVGVTGHKAVDLLGVQQVHRVATANEVRALMGVLHTDEASKGFLTTTFDVAPRLCEDPLVKPLIPKQLELINGTELLKRLNILAK